MSRLLLPISTAVLALVPIATGIISMSGVRDQLYRPLQLLGRCGVCPNTEPV
jgi:hypothetical protein